MHWGFPMCGTHAFTGGAAGAFSIVGADAPAACQIGVTAWFHHARPWSQWWWKSVISDGFWSSTYARKDLTAVLNSSVADHISVSLESTPFGLAADSSVLFTFFERRLSVA